jgi:assimilatory nitrate reductase catalytic subunit
MSAGPGRSQGLGAGWRRAGAELLVRREGPLTRELLQTPAAFGLGRLPQRLAPEATTSMVCGFCSTGCALDVHIRDGTAVGLSPTRRYPVNLGMACPKGWEALRPLAAPNRATTPLLRRRGRLEETTWDVAIAEMVTRFKAVQERHGPAAVAWLGSGQLPTEEQAFLGALGKFGMGMQHGDGNTRQCMATTAVAYQQSFGFDAPPFTYADLELSDVIVLIGSNLCIAHPILWERICRNPHQPTIVVIDPRATETAMAAHQHYALRPQSDLDLLYAVAHVLIARDWIDHDYIARHVDGYDAFGSHVARFPPADVAERTGITSGRIEELAELIHRGERVSFWWTMGINQSHQGVRTAQAIIALALITGNVGRPGTGPNSITGQCNAMGSRIFSNTTNLLGGRDFANAEHRREVADALAIAEERIPRVGSLAYDQILDAVLEGKIRALWIIGTNPAHSWIHQGYLHDVLGRLDCLVVQDMYHDTETAALADIVLPAAGWGEKEGTFINSERRLAPIKRVARSPGLALADFHIFQLVASAWGCGEMFSAWTSPEEVFRLLARLSRGRPCDISGIDDYVMLDHAGGIQWPFPEGAELSVDSQRRLFEDGRFFTPNARARLLVAEPRPIPEGTNDEYPLHLLTGRGSSSQWHTQTRTRHSQVLNRLSPTELYFEISPAEARRLELRAGESATISSRRASVVARAHITPAVQPGHIFMPMHDAATNRLTFAAFDPFSRQPAYKGCAVKVTRL